MSTISLSLRRMGGVLLTCSLLIVFAILPGCGSATAPGPGRCTIDADCPEDQACDDGVCHFECTTSESCPEGQQCLSGFCRQPCNDDSRCGENEMCEDGFCVARPPNDGGSDADGDDG
ncbi:MAG: hypothetical protein JRJ19_07305, partial [Deltaproteobacteria bacterium]|nr:hypothetical protein [Deltaproteobacteria bacterium]